MGVANFIKKEKRKLRHFCKKHIARPLFPDPNDGATFVPESETSHAGPGEQPRFLLVGLKMADKTGKTKQCEIWRQVIFGEVI